MTPEWFALTGLFLMVVGQDYRQNYERDQRHLYRWAAFSFVGVMMFAVGAGQALSR